LARHEEELQVSIKAKLKGDERAFNKLFSSVGPLASLSSKIELAYLLGVSSSQQHSDLDKIRKMGKIFLIN